MTAYGDIYHNGDWYSRAGVKQSSPEQNFTETAIRAAISKAYGMGPPPVDSIPGRISATQWRSVPWAAGTFNEGGVRSLVLDIDLPSTPMPPAGYPVVCWLHPAGSPMYDATDLNLEAAKAECLAAGFAWVPIEHRHPVKNVDLGAPHTDVGLALQYLRSLAPSIPIDTANVFGLAQSRGSLCIWQSLQADMANPAAPTWAGRQSSLMKGIWAYQAQTTYSTTEYGFLAVLAASRAAFYAAYPDDARWGSALSSVATAPQRPHLVLLHRAAYPAGRVAYPDASLDEHWAGFGSNMVTAYGNAGASAKIAAQPLQAAEASFAGCAEWFTRLMNGQQGAEAFDSITAPKRLFAAAAYVGQRTGGALFDVPDSLGSIFQESAGATLPALNAPLGLLLDAAYGSPTLGPELCTNGDGNSVATWTANANVATAVSVGGVIQVTSTAGYGGVTQVVPTVPGKKYLCTLDLRSPNGSDPAQVYLRPNGNDDGTNQVLTTAVTSTYFTRQVYTFIATTAQIYVRLTCNKATAGGVSEFDNVSLREVIEPASMFGPELVTGAAGNNATYTNGQLIDNATNAYHGIDFIAACPVNRCQAKIRVKAGTKNWAWIFFNGVTAASAWVNVSTGAVGTVEAGVSVASVVPVGSGYFDITFNKVSPQTASLVAIYAVDANQAITQYVGTGAAALLIDSVSVKQVLGNHASQSISGSRPTLTRVPRKVSSTEIAVAGAQGGVSVPANNGTVALTGLASIIAGKSYRISGVPAGLRVSGPSGWNNISGGGYITVTANLDGQFYILNPTASPIVLDPVVSVREVTEWSYAMNFDGVDDSLQIASSIISGGGDWALVAAATPGSITPYPQTLKVKGATAEATIYVDVSGNGGALVKNDAGAITYVSTAGSGVPWQPNSGHVMTLVKSGTALKPRIDGKDGASQGTAPATPITLNAAQIGNTNTTGTIAFAAILPGSISAADLRTIERYAAYKIGLPYA